ncbi:calcium:proton antiporter [Caulobacter mirabilis]|nr:hypothetical protein [Caulobacter mirabilis]
MSTPAYASATPPPKASLRDLMPVGTAVRLAAAWGVVVLFLTVGRGWLADPIATPTAIACFVLLFATILYAAFGVVKEADHLAHALGEPYGTLILTLSIVSIEVILIAAVLLGPGETATIARDSIFAVMMIILNLVMGLCLVVGGLRYGEQEYNSQGAIAYLSMIVLLAGVALALPNVLSPGNGGFLPVQAVGVAVLTIALYAAFLAMQMRGYRRFFVQPEFGSLSIPVSVPVERGEPDGVDAPKIALDMRAIVLRSIILIALILPIVLLAHDMAILIDMGVQRAGAPLAVGGVLIAIIVFTPESITAVKAALANEMQRAINLCLGAFVSTVGLTVPAVLTIGLLTGKTVTLGLGGLDLVLLAITLAISALTFLGHRTSPVQGLVHLALFAIYGLLLFVP